MHSIHPLLSFCTWVDTSKIDHGYAHVWSMEKNPLLGIFFFIPASVVASLEDYWHNVGTYFMFLSSCERDFSSYIFSLVFYKLFWLNTLTFKIWIRIGCSIVHMTPILCVCRLTLFLCNNALSFMLLMTWLICIDCFPMNGGNLTAKNLLIKSF